MCSNEQDLLLALQVGFKEGPAGANQDNQGKNHNSLQKTKNIKQIIPSMGFFGSLNEILVLFLTE